jgi:hypothetical protein
VATVKLTVVLPTARANSTPATFQDVSGVTLQQKLTSAPVADWANLGPDIVPNAFQFDQNVGDVSNGSWMFAAVFHDALGGPDLRVESAPVEVGSAVVSPLVGGSISGVVVP